MWVLTTGLNAGVPKLIGEAINRHRLLNENTSKPTVIGITNWNLIHKDTRSWLEYQVLSILRSEGFSVCIEVKGLFHEETDNIGEILIKLPEEMCTMLSVKSSNRLYSEKKNFFRV